MGQFLKLIPIIVLLNGQPTACVPDMTQSTLGVTQAIIAACALFTLMAYAMFTIYRKRLARIA